MPMLKLGPLLRPVRRPSSRPPKLHARLRHGTSGPHKEYFQTPAQTQSLVKDFGYRPEHIQQALESSQPIKPSVLRRFLRGTSLFTTFLLIGWVAGQALITWEYFQPHYEVGSEEEQEFLKEINEALDTSSLVESLIEDGWVANNDLRDEVEEGGKHLLHETLSGVKGITMRYFRHPTEKAAVVACFMGFGIEGWPDVIHGGMIATLLDEAVSMTVRDVYSDLVTVSDSRTLSINYRRPVRPGQVYGVVLMPASLEVGSTPEGNEIFSNKYVATLFATDVAPQIHRRPSAEEGVTNHELAAGNGPDDLLAIAEVSFLQLPKQFFADLEAERPHEEVVKNLHDEFKRLIQKYKDEEAGLNQKALQESQTDLTK